MKLKNFTIVFSVITLLTTSCNDKDFLEVKAPVPPVASVSDLRGLTIAAYNNLAFNDGAHSSIDVVALVEAAMGDGVSYLYAGGSGGNSANVLDMYQRNNTTNIFPTDSQWKGTYSVIQHANLGLDVINSGSLNGLLDAKSIPSLKGELLFLRGYAYWMLLKLFCPTYEPGGANDTRVIPYVYERITGFANANQPAGETGKIYQNVLDDLTTAKELLGYDPADVGRVTKFAAAALLARVHFQMGNFQLAADECTFVIEQNGNRYALSEDPIEAWNNEWNVRGKETIWDFIMGNTPAGNGLRALSSFHRVPRRYAAFNWSLASSVNDASGIGNGLNGAVNRTTDRVLAISNYKLAEIGWVNADSTPTNKALQDKRFQQLYKYNDGFDPIFPALKRRLYYANKYYRAPQANNRIGPIPLIRLPEMYLTRAIIRFRTGDASGAAKDLDVVRARAWDAVAAGVDYTPLTAGEVTESLIHEERWKELSYEGDWLFYLQALKINISNGDRGSGEIPYNDAHLYWPIPLTERQLNQSLNQKLN